MEHGQRWKEDRRLRHAKLEAAADKVFYASEEYNKNCYHERNRFMVDRASKLICYWDGKPGGTAYTVDYEQQQELAFFLKDGKLAYADKCRKRCRCGYARRGTSRWHNPRKAFPQKRVRSTKLRG